MHIPSLPSVGPLPDPLRRARIPADLESVTSVGDEVPARRAGLSADGVEHIWEGVRRLYRSGAHPAIALCMRRNGHVVLDRAIGHRSGNGPGGPARSGADPVPISVQDPFCLFSASKAITAMVVHLLDQRGLLHIGDRVVEYFPEFGRNGKSGITIGQVLSHRAGVPIHPAAITRLETLHDRRAIIEALADAKPLFKPGERQAYHALSGGAILGEVVERVTGENIRTVLDTEILRPLGFRWLNYGVDAQDAGRVVVNYATGMPPPPPISTVLHRLLGTTADEAVRLSNDPLYLSAVVPAGNIYSTANELSRFYELLRQGGTLDGVGIFDPRTIRRAIAKQSYQRVDLTLGLPVGYSHGFMLGGKRISLFGPGTENAYGHLGFTNIIGWADPARGTTVALLTSGKPVVYPEVFNWLGIAGRIAAAVDR